MKKLVNTASFSDRYAKHIFTVGEENEELFKVLNHTITALNLMTVKQKADEEGISVQRVYKKYNTYTILGIKFVAEND